LKNAVPNRKYLISIAEVSQFMVFKETAATYNNNYYYLFRAANRLLTVTAVLQQKSTQIHTSYKITQQPKRNKNKTAYKATQTIKDILHPMNAMKKRLNKATPVIGLGGP
jgi:hypothetical protein